MGVPRRCGAGGAAAPPAFDGTYVLDALGAALVAGPGPVVLVLDRFESITNRRVVHDLDRVLRHAWRDLRIVMTSRRSSLDRFPAYLLTQDATHLDKQSLAFTTEGDGGPARAARPDARASSGGGAAAADRRPGRRPAALCDGHGGGAKEPGRVLGTIPQQRAGGA